MDWIASVGCFAKDLLGEVKEIQEVAADHRHKIHQYFWKADYTMTYIIYDDDLRSVRSPAGVAGCPTLVCSGRRKTPIVSPVQSWRALVLVVVLLPVSGGHFWWTFLVDISGGHFWWTKFSVKSRSHKRSCVSVNIDGWHLSGTARPSHLQWRLHSLHHQQPAKGLQGDEEWPKGSKERRLKEFQPVFAGCRPQQPAAIAQQQWQEQQQQQRVGAEQNGQLQLQPTAGRRYSRFRALAWSFRAPRPQFWPLWLAILKCWFEKFEFRSLREPSIWRRVWWGFRGFEHHWPPFRLCRPRCFRVLPEPGNWLIN